LKTREITPEDIHGLIYTTIMELFSSLIIANIFGLIVLLVAQMKEKHEKFEE
jgi:hypothetical protein